MIKTPFHHVTGTVDHDTTTHLSNTHLYSHDQCKDFGYEDIACLQGNIVKGIPNGYKDFDLDALMHTDKVEDHSQALHSVCLAVETTRCIEDKLIPYGSNEVFMVYKNFSDESVPRALNLTISLQILLRFLLKMSLTHATTTLTYIDEVILKTYKQDMIWTWHTIENSITSSSLQHEVHLELDTYESHDCTGPLHAQDPYG